MSQPRVADQMLGTAVILGGKGRGIGLGLAHRIVVNGWTAVPGSMTSWEGSK